MFGSIGEKLPVRSKQILNNGVQILSYRFISWMRETQCFLSLCNSRVPKNWIKILKFIIYVTHTRFSEVLNEILELSLVNVPIVLVGIKKCLRWI